jgi:methylenetetrahydrofolate reductase (NADPH)
MAGFTVETTPVGAVKVADFRDILRPDTDVYVTFLPGSDYKDSIATAKRLRAEGFEPVPHFAARSITSTAQFEDYLGRCAGEAGVRRVLTIAGAVEKPLGPYSDSMQLLDSGLFDKHGITSIGVAGHPEGSPDMSDEAIRDALEWKNAFAERTDAALYILTQFCFEAEPIIAWDRMLNAAGNRLPIRIGVPGNAKLSTLIKYAAACGVGNSIRFLKRQGSAVANLLRQQAPDKLVRDLAAYAANDPNCGINGVHMYPLGGLKKTALWSYGVVDGAFTLGDDGGFDVAVDLS